MAPKKRASTPPSQVDEGDKAPVTLPTTIRDTAAMMQNVPLMSLSDIEQAEQQLLSEYRHLTVEFARARLPRINDLIRLINETTTTTERNHRQYTDYVTSKLAEFEKHSHDLYERCTRGSEGLAGRRKAQPLSPSLTKLLETDPSRPNTTEYGFFPQAWQKIEEPYQKELQRLWMAYRHSVQLIDRTTEANRLIVWQQYFASRLKRKEELLAETNRELCALDREYTGASHNRMDTLDDQAYLRSLRKPTDKKGSKAVRQVVQKRVTDRHTRAQSLAKKMDRTKLSSLSALCEREIADDACLLRERCKPPGEPSSSVCRTLPHHSAPPMPGPRGWDLEPVHCEAALRPLQRPIPPISRDSLPTPLPHPEPPSTLYEGGANVHLGEQGLNRPFSTAEGELAVGEGPRWGEDRMPFHRSNPIQSEGHIPFPTMKVEEGAVMAPYHPQTPSGV